MIPIIKNSLLGCLTLLLICCQTPTDNQQEQTQDTPKEWRIVSLNGTITELLFEVGLGDAIVGVDRTSTYPASAQKINNLGHVSKLNIEAILALEPNMVLIDKKNAQTTALDVLRKADISIQVVDIPQTLDGALVAAKKINTIFDGDWDTQSLAQKTATNKAKIKEIRSKMTNPPKVLFIYARGAQTLMVAGKNTFAEAMIEIAGGQHLMKDFDSFKPLTPEALLKYQPEVILMFESALASLAQQKKNTSPMQGLLSIQGMQKTPAGKHKNVLTFDGLALSGFGPRASDIAVQLSQQLLDIQRNMATK